MKRNYTKLLTFLGSGLLVFVGVMLVHSNTHSAPFGGGPMFATLDSIKNETGQLVTQQNGTAATANAVNTTLKIHYSLTSCDNPTSYPSQPLALYVDGSGQPFVDNILDYIAGPADNPSAPLCGNFVQIDIRNIPSGPHSIAVQGPEWGTTNYNLNIDHTTKIVVSLPSRTPPLSGSWHIFADAGIDPCTLTACAGSSGQTFTYFPMHIPDSVSYTIAAPGVTVSNVSLSRFAEKNPIKRFFSSIFKKVQADNCSSTDSCTILGGGQIDWQVTPFSCTVTVNTQANGNGVNLGDGSGGVINSTPNTTTAQYTVTDSVGNILHTGSNTFTVAGGSYTITPSAAVPSVNIAGTVYLSDINSSSVLSGLCSSGTPSNVFSIGYKTRPVLDVK